MTGSGKDNKEGLLGLFSTRATQTRINSQALTQSPAKPGVPLSAPEQNASTALTPSSTQEAIQKGSEPAKTPAKPPPARGPETSPAASTVMKEVRRELGSDASLQQQMTSQATTERVIAQAVDLCIQSTEPVIDSRILQHFLAEVGDIFLVRVVHFYRLLTSKEKIRF